MTHCFLHRYALACKTLPKFLQTILSVAVKIINFIRARALNHRLFKELCREIGSQHEVLLLHTEVRWLSRGKILTRLLELHVEVSIFLTEKDNSLLQEFQDANFLLGLAYLADVFAHINAVNLSMQGPSVYIFDAYENLQGWLNKLPLWRSRVEKENYMNFPSLEKELQRVDTEIARNSKLSTLKNEIVQHLQILETSFHNYFVPGSRDVHPWIREPFLVELDYFEDSDLCKDEMIELRS